MDKAILCMRVGEGIRATQDEPCICGYSQQLVEELAAYAGVPVWNGLTDEFHPTQMLADLLTIEEKFGRLKGSNFTYMGDARNNMGNSLMVACAKMGLNFTACAPKELFPAAELVEKARTIAAPMPRDPPLTKTVFIRITLLHFFNYYTKNPFFCQGTKKKRLLFLPSCAIIY